MEEEAIGCGPQKRRPDRRYAELVIGAWEWAREEFTEHVPGHCKEPARRKSTKREGSGGTWKLGFGDLEFQAKMSLLT